MRRYQIALFIAIVMIALLAGAAGYLWFHPRFARTGGASNASSGASPVAPPPAGYMQAAKPKLAAVQLTPQRMQTIGVTTGPVEYKSLHRVLRTTGNVEPDETRVSPIQIRYSGWIQRVLADTTYQRVEKGQTLVTIYSPEIAATEREYVLARENREMLAQSTVPGVAAGASSVLTAAAERLRQWQIGDRPIAQLDSGNVPKEVEVTSPVSGVITERNAFASNFVQPGTKLYTIADLSRVWVNAQVFESDIAQVRIGDSATITSNTGLKVKGRVNFIEPRVDDATRTVTVRVEAANPDLRLALGMFVNVEIDAPLGRQLTIPASALFYSGTRQIAFVEQGSGYFEPRDVETGAQDEDDVVVLSGLKAGEKVVTSANFLIDSESQVQAAAGAFAPPPPGAGAAAAMNGPAEQVTIDYSSAPSPPKPGSNFFRVKLTDAGKPVSGAVVTVTYFMAAMPAMGMAAMRSTATLQDKGNGIYEGTGEVQMTGTWQVTVVAAKKGRTIAQKQLDVKAGGSR
jgi:Cu(I)/Ag(I) efflux system membrane fusion protein/cobalt-zinc-cadmium efflux system membrane fusion protein